MKNNKVGVIECLSQSPDVNQIDNQWTNLKKQVRTKKAINQIILHNVCQEEWVRASQQH